MVAGGAYSLVACVEVISQLTTHPFGDGEQGGEGRVTLDVLFGRPGFIPLWCTLMLGREKRRKI